MSRQNTFIIAEAGSNWRMGTKTRDLTMAKSLIDVAAECKCNAIKFQTYKSETTYVQNAGKSDYLSNSGINEQITEIFDDLSMPYDMIPQLADYCKMQKIEFMSTPFSVNDAKAIDPFVSRHKIASFEINHMRLIEFLARTKKPLILSTGASTLEEIEWAINHFNKNGGKEITLLHTISKYPAPLSSLNLQIIHELQKKFNVVVGFSDHSRDPLVGPISAVALGAKIIEKHFTLHNKLPGPDHSFAITPDELKKMVWFIRECESTLNSTQKNILPDELELRQFAHRGIQAIKNIKKNDVFKEGINVDILRPGKRKQGIHPMYIEMLEGKNSKKDISTGDGISLDDWE
jgi:N-acetylneuraminate synthase